LDAIVEDPEIPIGEGFEMASTLIESLKKVSIPVNTGINCFFYSVKWRSCAGNLDQSGADAVQVVSYLYGNGPKYLKELLG